MNNADRISRYLDDPTPDNLRTLFGEVLAWQRNAGIQSVSVGKPLHRSLQLERIATAAGIRVFALECEHLPTLGERRAILNALQPLAYEHILIYTATDPAQVALVWTNLRNGDKQHPTTELRLLPYIPGAPARTTLECLHHLVLPLDTELTPELVRQRITDAFSVEAVTSRFFADYQHVFQTLQQILHEQSQDIRWAHDYALQLLNRIVFLYFIQRKRFANSHYWLGNDPAFVRHFWNAYRQSGQPANTFFDRWLSVLFFEAFTRKFHSGHRHFPPSIRDALAQAPYLNGGLFAQNRLDLQHQVTIGDDFFELLFDRFNGSTPGFLERYNFTITESTPLDVEVAVDPEMIGKVYESLVNITTEGIATEDRRGAAGIFYTPRVEIDLMCRLSLVDTLANHLSPDTKWLLYDAVFATDPADKDAADCALAEHNLWTRLNEVLRKITVCDPACGSGSFLVGMLLVLDDLQARANAQLGIEETPYERRRRIIGEQLYGVDVMDWAVHVAELRLWLQLTVETKLEQAEAHLRPLLPNLSFKVRCGDSLVQEIGGINFGLHRHHLDIPVHLKGRITQLKGKKLRFYQGDTSLHETDLKQEEIAIVRDILQHKQHALRNQIATLNRQIESAPDQDELPGMGTGKPKQERLKLQQQWRAERDEKQAELDRIQAALNALTRTQTVPLVWDIAFVEIFEGDSAGFDIVIGNPPYVRQEMIAPPTLDPKDFGGENSERWKEQKKAYKAKLQESVAAAWHKFFQYKPGSGTFRKLDGKSDLYIYFYLHGLSLLNPRGSFCFITSNSWLDVGYGADLQEFLLRHSHVKFILDNQCKRSFAQADVNTIIALLGPADDRHEHGLDNIARFVMFKAPFEDVASAETFKALEAATKRQSTDRWRVSVRTQRELLEESLERDEEDETPAGKTTRGPLIKTARYVANKWGGKYLRAPDIFFTILEKGQGKLVRLGDIAEVRFGIKTGANEFFYLDEERIAQWGIEEEFLKPVIKSPRECRSIVIKPEDLRYKIFMCHKDKSELKGTAALEYIRWGESQGFHQRPTCRTRQRWWNVGAPHHEQIAWAMIQAELHNVYYNPKSAELDHNFFEIIPRKGNETIYAALSVSTLAILSKELLARTYGGGSGPIKNEGVDLAQFIFLNYDALSRTERMIISERFRQLASRPMQPVLNEIHQPDRRALDDVVFDVLGLTSGEREAVYEAVVELVRARLEKARSV